MNIEQLARDAGIQTTELIPSFKTNAATMKHICYENALNRFAALVIGECANVCDGVGNESKNWPDMPGSTEHATVKAVRNMGDIAGNAFAEALRAQAQEIGGE